MKGQELKQASESIYQGIKSQQIDQMKRLSVSYNHCLTGTTSCTTSLHPNKIQTGKHQEYHKNRLQNLKIHLLNILNKLFVTY